MAINPNDITTVQVKDLPPAALTLTSIIPHEIGDILHRATIQELANLIQAQTVSQAYEIKYIRAPNPLYISSNFNMTPGATQGLGIVGGLWQGWAICNGNNGTDNLSGITLIGYGATYPTVGIFVGAETHTLTVNQIPPHTHQIAYNLNDAGGAGSQRTLDNGGVSTTFNTTTSVGSGQAHNNMQPSMSILIIMKLP
jgi:hypothetical protein